MRLLPINSLQSKQMQFNGLWGKSVSEFNAEESGTYIERITDYHPFKDEPKESISGVIEQYVNSKNSENSQTIRCRDYIHVRRKLPFTQNEYINYKNLQSENSSKLSPLEQKVLVSLKKLGLEDYIKEPHRNFKLVSLPESFKLLMLKLFR